MRGRSGEVALAIKGDEEGTGGGSPGEKEAGKVVLASVWEVARQVPDCRRASSWRCPSKGPAAGEGDAGGSRGQRKKNEVARVDGFCFYTEFN